MNEIIHDAPEDASGMPPSSIMSRFLFVDIAALRAKQLRRGARPRVDLTEPNAPHKAERVAMEEVWRGLVHYDVHEAGPTTKEASE